MHYGMTRDTHAAIKALSGERVPAKEIKRRLSLPMAPNQISHWAKQPLREDSGYRRGADRPPLPYFQPTDTDQIAIELVKAVDAEIEQMTVFLEAAMLRKQWLIDHYVRPIAGSRAVTTA